MSSSNDCNTRIVIDSGTLKDFGAEASAVLNRSSLSLVEVRLIALYCEAHADNDDVVKVNTGLESQQIASHQIGNTSIVVNVKTALVVAGATWLDTLVTGGVANAIVALTGMTTRGVAKLDVKRGELCNYLAIKSVLNKNPTAKSLLEYISEKKCWQPQMSCSYRQSNLCSISADDVEKNLYEIEKKDVVTIERGSIECRM